VHAWRILTDPGYVREVVFKRDGGICAKCETSTCADLDLKLKPWRGWRGSGHRWHADHIVPVVEGGGECDLENYRTLCVTCHKQETAALRARLAEKRRRENELPLLGARR
jgi:5-methylcytosine-specific restriction endonuclease McrA